MCCVFYITLLTIQYNNMSIPAILAHWTLTSFLGFSWPICFTFTSCYYANGPTSYHFMSCWRIGILSLSSGSHGPFASIVFLSFFSSYIFLHYWVFSFVGHFVKNGYQYNTIIKNKIQKFSSLPLSHTPLPLPHI